MKTVLIVGADFVPSSLPPALRIRFLARHLPEFGWKPIILTTDPSFYEHSVDEENERLLPEGLEVIRTAALTARWTRRLGIGDLGIRSLWHHWKSMNQLCSQRRIDAMVIPVPPSVPMVLGRLAWERFRVPYVVDYIDPWVTDYYKTVPRNQRPPKWRLAHTMARTLEPFAVRRVAHITGVSQGTTDSVVGRYAWLSADDATEIPYGGEPADFAYLRRNPRPNSIFNRHDGFFHLSYIGACIPAMHPALRALFMSIKDGLERAPGLFQRLRLHFAGTTYARDSAAAYQVLPIAREIGIGALVTELPARIPYLDALQVLLDSHATVVLGSDQPHYTASKLFPYILAGKPLLAIFHEQSSAVKILQTTHAGHVITFGTCSPICGKSVMVQHWLAGVLSENGNFHPATDWNAFEACTTRAMSGRLAGALEKALTKAGQGRSAAAGFV